MHTRRPKQPTDARICRSLPKHAATRATGSADIARSHLRFGESKTADTRCLRTRGMRRCRVIALDLVAGCAEHALDRADLRYGECYLFGRQLSGSKSYLAAPVAALTEAQSRRSGEGRPPRLAGVLRPGLQLRLCLREPPHADVPRLSPVNGERSHHSHRCSSVIPAIRAIRSNSANSLRMSSVDEFAHCLQINQR